MPHSTVRAALDVACPPLVLLVDNDVDNREMYAEYLRLQGFRVIACADSAASLDIASSVTPDIILLELRMNGLNGLQMIARLKREPLLHHVPIVALTASVLSFERDAAMAAGFTALLPKPCFPEDLADAIVHILDGDFDPVQVPAPHPARV
jgi:CheY-like chemotaxis protein